MNERLDQGRDMTADEAQGGYTNAVEQLRAAEEEMVETLDTQRRTIEDVAS